MTSPLQKSPLGLLARFNLKTLGDAPNRFGDTVLPVADVGGAYSADLLTFLNTNGAVGAGPVVTAVINVTVPVIVRAVNVSYNPGAAPDDTWFHLECRISAGNGQPTPCIHDQVVNGITPPAGLWRTGLLLPYPLWLAPGAQLVGTVTTDSSQNDIQAQVTAIVELLP